MQIGDSIIFLCMMPFMVIPVFVLVLLYLQVSLWLPGILHK